MGRPRPLIQGATTLQLADSVVCAEVALVILLGPLIADQTKTLLLRRMPVTVGTKHRDPSINVSGPRIVVHDPAAATDGPSQIKAPWSVHASNWPDAATVSEGYCGQRLRISGAGHRGTPPFSAPVSWPTALYN